MSWAERVSRRWTSRWQRWLELRVKPQNENRFHRRNLFIMPTREGWIYAAILLAVFLAGINYQNNLCLLVAFTMMAVGQLAIFSTFLNLSGLVVRALPQIEGWYQGETADIRFVVAHPGQRARIALWLVRQAHLVRLDVPSSGEVQVVLPLLLTQRGWNACGRLRLESSYPLGLLRCWTWFDPDVQVLAWPVPIKATPQIQVSSDDRLQQGVVHQGDIDGLDSWREGEALSRIAWRQSIRQERMLSRQFEKLSESPTRIDWRQWAGLPVERCLSAMAHQVEVRCRQGLGFELVLPGQRIACDGQAKDKRICLDALAKVGGNVLP